MQLKITPLKSSIPMAAKEKTGDPCSMSKGYPI